MAPLAPTAPADPTSQPPFLRLPPEIRNTIYELALTAPRSLVLDMNDPVNPDRPVLYLPEDEHRPDRASNSFESFSTTSQKRGYDYKQRHAYNQLKFVNKQIREETKGLELKLNNVRLLTGKQFTKVLLRLSSFIDTMKPGQDAWISKLVIDGSHKFRFHDSWLEFQHQHESITYLRAIQKFCIEHQHIFTRLVMRSTCIHIEDPTRDPGNIGALAIWINILSRDAKDFFCDGEKYLQGLEDGLF